MPPKFVIEDFPMKYFEFRDGDFSDRVLLQYLCTIISELSYHEVSAFEIGKYRRLRIVPAEGYHEILKSRTPTSVASIVESGLFREGGADIQLFQTNNSAVLSVQFEDSLFLSFRGTVVSYGPDWKVNFNTALTRLLPLYNYYASIGVHSGFLNEAIGLSMMLNRQLRKRPFNRIYYVGHSLGGALASVCASLLNYELWQSGRHLSDDFQRAEAKMVGFGTPRQGNESFHWLGRGELQKTFYKNENDLVTCVPSKSFGYISNPEQRTPFLTPICDETASVGKFRAMLKWQRFLLSGAQAHRIERYRKDCRIALDGHLDTRPFCDLDAIKLP